MSYCVVTFLYKPYYSLTNNERICLDSIHRNFDSDIVYYICPYSFDVTDYNITEENVVRFPDEYFQSLESYNRLCTNYSFYETFKDFDYMLIHQIDAYTIKNNVEYFISLGYDYYGAPWRKLEHLENVCGNGGYSLRKISKMIEICKKLGQTDWYEDNWFCIRHRDMLNVCPLEVGWKFSFETYFPQDGTIPMGCHKLFEYNPILWIRLIKNPT